MRLGKGAIAVVMLASSFPLVTATQASALPAGFQVSTVISGLDTPTAVRFSPDGRVFVSEKSGLIKVFDDINDTTASIFADLSTNVYSHMDRGLLGMELHPNFPATPYVYVAYTHDAAIGGTAPRWGTPGVLSDPCPDPPGALSDGCVASARLSRLEASGNVMTGTERVLVEDWCSQYPSHSIGTVTFGPDGALYAGGGDGAKANDWGQFGNPINPCGDPPGGSMAPPTSEGGSLRSQDVRTMGDPVGLDGTIIRVDPETGAGVAGNPMASSSDANARRVIAHGFRNPFRFAFRPGTDEIYIADVGFQRIEEINRIPSASDAVMENFGWPCYEGNPRNAPFDNRDFNLCEQLYAQPGAAAQTFFEYVHDTHAYPGDGCRPGGGVISAIGFYEGGSYPAQYNGAMFFGDYARNCIWVMFPNQSGQIDRNTIMSFHTSAGYPVDLQTGPGGDMFYVDVIGRIRRISYFSANQPPVAEFVADPTFGSAPLEVDFDAASSTDPEGSILSFSWDLNGDGVYGDATSVNPSFTYNDVGDYLVRLRVTDAQGAISTASRVISVGNTPPTATITSPTSGFTWHVGETVAFSGTATDNETGTLSASALSWDVILHHCPTECHEHPVQSFDGQANGSFPASDHEYPSHLEIRLTATDPQGLSDTTSLLLYPETTTVTMQSEPAGLSLGLNAETVAAPFTRTVVVGSTNALTAPSPQTFEGSPYNFASWSDGGSRIHDVVVGSSPSTYTASFALAQGIEASLLDSGFSPRDLTAIGLGQTVTWTNTGTRAHTVTDNSGMNLFDSGAVPPGGTYARAWTAAGRYAIQSTLDANYRGSVWLPLNLSPTTGAASTNFTVTWATAAQPAGFVSDVDIQRPGSTAWVPWRTGQTALSAAFVPDAGQGTYSFRARLRNTANGRATAYTVAASILVTAGNQSPTAAIATNTTSGATPLTVNFDGSASSDPEGGALSYSWDLNGDGVYGDATTPTTSYTYTTSGDRTARLRVTDPEGGTGLASVLISAGNVPPAAVIDAPASGATWAVGETIAFSGSGSDPEDGTIQPSGASWTVTLHHCPSDCHPHVVMSASGQLSGSFVAPDHAHPSHIEVVLTVTDTNGQSSSVSRILQPRTSSLTVNSSPAGLALSLNAETAVTPFTRTVIVGSANVLNAPSPQSAGGVPYAFTSWSDGGAQSHQVIAGSSPASYLATYQMSSSTAASMTDSGYVPGDLMLSLGQTAVWTNTGASNHTVTEAAGMGLFDSGPVPPSGTYSYNFFAAGRYLIRSTLDANYRASVWVPMSASATSGSTSSTFTMIWATAPAPLGYVYDVQVQRPGSPAFVSWRYATAAPEAAFTPDAGPGTYSFRARIRNSGNGRASAYTENFSLAIS